MPVEPLALHTDDDLRLEAELHVPDSPWAAAVLAHPHPQHGGSMRSIVTGAQFRGLPERGLAVLRFNFRGVGRSGGEHDFGRGERLDIVAALDALHAITEGLPLILSGWSFGADVSLASIDDRIDAWVAVAPPLRTVPLAELAAATASRTKVVVVPEHDQFCPPDRVRSVTAGWVNTEVRVVAGADHFLVGKTDAAVEAVVDAAHTVTAGG